MKLRLVFSYMIPHKIVTVVHGEKCSTQSWFTEAPSAYRGNRKDFPSLAVIVGNTIEEITIYDGDDPNLPMFIDFTKIIHYYIMIQLALLR